MEKAYTLDELSPEIVLELLNREIGNYHQETETEFKQRVLLEMYYRKKEKIYTLEEYILEEHDKSPEHYEKNGLWIHPNVYYYPEKLFGKWLFTERQLNNKKRKNEIKWKEDRKKLLEKTEITNVKAFLYLIVVVLGCALYIFLCYLFFSS